MLLAALTVLFVFAPCFSVDWELVGLSNRTVKTLHQYNQLLYVGTDDGVYKTNLDDALSSWEFLGMSGNSVRALIVTGQDTILAGLTSGTAAIYRTTDGGQSWAPYENGWGGGSFHPVFAFEPVSIVRSTGILATGIAVIGMSPNSGQSWQVLWGDWSAMAMGLVFIRVDPNISSIIWAGGESAALSPVLLKSVNHGEDWAYMDIYTGGDNRCHDIAIFPGNSDKAWVSMEGRIRKTSNGGDNWFDVIINDYYIYGIEIDSLRPNFLYASGFKYGEPLTLFKSEDSGSSWSTYYEMTHSTNGAYDILMLSLVDRNVIYFGTDYGVYRYNDVVSFICGDANGDEVVNILDITFLIAYLYKEGPAPDPLEKADVNSSGNVNILDITYLIAFLYKDGPEPVCL